MDAIKPAIVVVGYNRPKAIERLLKSIVDADYPFDDIPLIFSLDHSDNTEQIIHVINDKEWIHGELLIINHEERMGLKKHILSCGDLTNTYGAIILLEDDLIVSKNFYNFAYEAINAYKDFDNICGVALYSHSWNGFAAIPFLPLKNEYDTYLGQFSITWGQCWTKEQWGGFRQWICENESSIYEELQVPQSVHHWGEESWGKLFVYYIVETDKYYVIPYDSLSTNCSEIGEHNSMTMTTFQTRLMNSVKKNYKMAPIEEAVKYDIFCELILRGKKISGIDAENICFNLNGARLHCDNEFIITTEIKDGSEVIDSFAMELRPIEENILNNVKGKDIFLMKSKQDGNNRLHSCSVKRRFFETYGLTWKNAFKIGVFLLFDRLKRI